MEVPTLGIAILDGATRVSTPNGLVRLDELGGDDVDLTNYYNKNEVDTRLLFKQHIISSTSGAGQELWDSTNNMVKRLVAGTGVTLTIDANGNVVLDSTGGGSGIPSQIADFKRQRSHAKCPRPCI